jgi:phage-related protein
MNKQIFPLLLFSLAALACALIPLTAAQTEGNMLTDGVQWITDGAGNLWNQASTFVSEQPLATGALATTGGAAGVLGVAYKSASSAKTKLQSALNGVTGKFESAQQKASDAAEQLKTYQSQAQTQIETYKTQASSATEQLGGIQDKLTQANQQKASALNEIETLKAQLKTAHDQLAVLKPQIK